MGVRRSVLLPAAHQGTNGFAIAALIFGIIGGALLGFIFGFIALSQTKRTGQNGRGMAIAGIVLSALWTVGVLLLIILAVASSTPSGPVTPTTFPTASPTAEPTTEPPITTAPSTAISATELQVGDCLNGPHNSTDVSSLPSVACTQPHQGEVFAVFDLPPGPYPGADGVDDLVSKGCNARLAEYSPGAPSDDAVGLFSVYPLEQNWERGDREVVCIAEGHLRHHHGLDQRPVSAAGHRPVTKRTRRGQMRDPGGSGAKGRSIVRS